MFFLALGRLALSGDVEVGLRPVGGGCLWVVSVGEEQLTFSELLTEYFSIGSEQLEEL